MSITQKLIEDFREDEHKLIEKFVAEKDPYKKANLKYKIGLKLSEFMVDAIIEMPNKIWEKFCEEQVTRVRCL